MNNELTIMTTRELKDISVMDFNAMPEEERLAVMQHYFGPKMQTRAAMLFFQNKSIILMAERKKVVYAAAIEQAPEISESIAAKGPDYVCYHQPLISPWDN